MLELNMDYERLHEILVFRAIARKIAFGSLGHWYNELADIDTRPDDAVSNNFYFDVIKMFTDTKLFKHVMPVFEHGAYIDDSYYILNDSRVSSIAAGNMALYCDTYKATIIDYRE